MSVLSDEPHRHFEILNERSLRYFKTEVSARTSSVQKQTNVHPVYRNKVTYLNFSLKHSLPTWATATTTTPTWATRSASRGERFNEQKSNTSHTKLDECWEVLPQRAWYSGKKKKHDNFQEYLSEKKKQELELHENPTEQARGCPEKLNKKKSQPSIRKRINRRGGGQRTEQRWCATVVHIRRNSKKMCKLLKSSSKRTAGY